MMVFLLPLLSWSQSYPYQRIEGSDTVVVMTKKQGEDINNIFRINKLTIDSLGNKIVHQSIASASSYLKTDRKNLKRAIKDQRLCKKHIVKYEIPFEGKISSQDSKD